MVYSISILLQIFRRFFFSLFCGHNSLYLYCCILSSVMQASSLPCPALYTTEYVGAGKAGKLMGIGAATATGAVGTGCT